MSKLNVMGHFCFYVLLLLILPSALNQVWCQRLYDTEFSLSPLGTDHFLIGVGTPLSHSLTLSLAIDTKDHLSFPYHSSGLPWQSLVPSIKMLNSIWVWKRILISHSSTFSLKLSMEHNTRTLALSSTSLRSQILLFRSSSLLEQFLMESIPSNNSTTGYQPLVVILLHYRPVAVVIHPFSLLRVSSSTL